MDTAARCRLQKVFLINLVRIRIEIYHLLINSWIKVIIQVALSLIKCPPQVISNKEVSKTPLLLIRAEWCHLTFQTTNTTRFLACLFQEVITCKQVVLFPQTCNLTVIMQRHLKWGHILQRMPKITSCSLVWIQFSHLMPRESFKSR